jgi:hypothetical protein
MGVEVSVGIGVLVAGSGVFVGWFTGDVGVLVGRTGVLVAGILVGTRLGVAVAGLAGRWVAMAVAEGVTVGAGGTTGATGVVIATGAGGGAAGPGGGVGVGVTVDVIVAVPVDVARSVEVAATVGVPVGSIAMAACTLSLSAGNKPVTWVGEAACPFDGLSTGAIIKRKSATVRMRASTLPAIATRCTRSPNPSSSP